MKNKLLDEKVVQELLEITYKIYSVYNSLVESKINGNQADYQENLKNLQLCTKLEETIYKKIPNNPKFMDQILRIINYINESQQKDIERKNAIMNRIMEYIFERAYPNPFLSMKDDEELQQEENELAIYNQYYLDSSYLTNSLLNEKIENESSQEIKIFLIRYQHLYIMNYKLNEYNLLLKKEDSITGRQRAFLFNQSSVLISKIYCEETINVIENINLEFIATKETITKTEELEALIIICTLSLKSAFALLESEEIEYIWKKLQENQKIEGMDETIKQLLTNSYIEAKNKATFSLNKSKKI